MTISKTMVRYYLSFVTVAYYNHHDVHPEQVEGYNECIPNLVKMATLTDDLEWLKLALQHLLNHPEINTDDLGGGSYAYDDQALRAIIAHLWKTVWPNDPPTPLGLAPAVELVEMESDDWLALRSSMGNPSLSA